MWRLFTKDITNILIIDNGKKCNYRSQLDLDYAYMMQVLGEGDCGQTVFRLLVLNWNLIACFEKCNFLEWLILMECYATPLRLWRESRNFWFFIMLPSVLNLQSRDCGYSGGLLGFNSELGKGSNEWERAVKGS